ncbi:MAG: AbiV family abortive infection protein [Lutibacter sp.]|nr:AbiV family abortive infection protein [Lutibacter sp.]
MITFNTLSIEKSKYVDNAIFKNARQLKKDALLIANTYKSFASATSLLILSSEEIIKAILILLRSEGYKIYDIKGANKFFKDHKIRHEIAQLIEMGAGLFDVASKWEDRKPNKIAKTNIKWLDKMVNGVFDIVEASKPLIDSAKRIEILESFNELKNNGLYVDYKNEIIEPHIAVNQLSYNNTKEIVDRVFRFYKGLRLLFHPKIANHLPLKEINSIKSDLKMLIEKAMSEYSFENNKPKNLKYEKD